MIHSSIGMLLTGWRTQAWFYLLDDCCHYFWIFCDRSSNFRLLDLSASKHWSPAVTHHSQSYSTVKWETVKTCFLDLKHKKTLKRVKNVLWQHQILLIYLLVPIVDILNLVTLTPFLSPDLPMFTPHTYLAFNSSLSHLFYLFTFNFLLFYHLTCFSLQSSPFSLSPFQIFSSKWHWLTNHLGGGGRRVQKIKNPKKIINVEFLI